MPRKYIRKKKKTCDLSALMNAVDAVKSGHLSIRKAAIEFDVPKTTLHDTLKEKYQDAGMPGRKPALPVNIENRIANALKEASRQGMGVSRQGMGVSRQGMGVSRQGMGVSRQGMGVSRL